MEKIASLPLHDSPSLQALRGLIASGAPTPEEAARLLLELEREQHPEHALNLLRQARPDPAAWAPFLVQLKSLVAKGRARRMSLWQVDPHRRTLRLGFEVRHPACEWNPSVLVNKLASLLLDAGLPVAMGLEKNPRPAVHLGHPLPLQVEGLGEWADAVLQEAPGTPLEALPARINRHAPAGLRILHCAVVPNYASPVADLCRQGQWRWECPPGLLEAARERMARFQEAELYQIEKVGKVEGQKEARLVEIRHLLGEIRWDGAQLHFCTRIGPGEAANPRKLLAGILGLSVAEIQPLCRTGIDLREDPRLLQAEKFTPKLHNMFEDAVLLDAGSNVRIIEDEDDEPLRLG